MRFGSTVGGALTVVALAAPAAGEPPSPSDYVDWAHVQDAARYEGPVYFNAWGGDAKINAYIAWAAEEIARYDVELVHVKLADTAEAVARVVADSSVGRDEGGGIDLMWINGENFAAMKAQGLLFGPWVDMLPYSRLIDTADKPSTLVDFTIPVEGMEMPWGMAQLVFIHDSADVPEPPRDPSALLAWAESAPGRFTYPAPPDFVGTTFLKQVMLTLARDDTAFGAPPADQATFAALTAPLWDWLDAIHPHLWRGGDVFPTGYPALRQLMNDGEIDVMMAFNPGEASSAVSQGLLPETARTYVLDGGSIGNTHFLAIPYNASAPAAAMVVANFLLSPEAQARKADPTVWGDPTVLDVDRLVADERASFDALPLGLADLAPADLGPILPEPHPAWTEALEAAWLERYGQ